jgi:hypothetical protein
MRKFHWIKFHQAQLAMYLKFGGKIFASAVKVAIILYNIYIYPLLTKDFTNESRWQNFSPGENLYVYSNLLIVIDIGIISTTPNIISDAFITW